MSAESDKALVLYDGVCGLCNGFVRFLNKRDRRDQFRFAPLQSDMGRELVEKHGGNPDELRTVYLVLDHGTDKERTLRRAKAALACIARLGGLWTVLGALRIFPAFLLDPGYLLIARYRYRWFGKHDSCPLPSPEERHKFLA